MTLNTGKIGINFTIGFKRGCGKPDGMSSVEIAEMAWKMIGMLQGGSGHDRI